MPGRRAREIRVAPRGGGDFFVTPPEVTRALLERELLPRVVHEPACGNGAIAGVLQLAGHTVIASDLHDRGFGTPGVDFLMAPAAGFGPGDAIVTNPPFSLAREFAIRAVGLRVRKVCLLARLGFLEGQDRLATLFGPHPPARVWVFSSRQTLWRGDDPNPRSSGGAVAYAWAVWERDHPGPLIGWIP